MTSSEVALYEVEVAPDGTVWALGVSGVEGAILSYLRRWNRPLQADRGEVWAVKRNNSGIVRRYVDGEMLLVDRLPPTGEYRGGWNHGAAVGPDGTIWSHGSGIRPLG